MKHKKHILLAIPAASLFVAALALAGPQKVQPLKTSSVEETKTVSPISYPATVVELFTSQGCSSCPPTNKLVHDIASNDGLLALTYSVDYWDYLGWKDTLGSPEFSKRQRKYGQHFQGQVYTPQIVLNGDSHAARFRPDHISGTKLDKSDASLVVVKASDGLHLKAEGQAGTVVAVSYTPGSQSVPVARGENRGRTITLANVVTSVEKLGGWKKGDGFQAIIDLPAKGEAVALLVQDGDGGPILTAVNYLP